MGRSLDNLFGERSGLILMLMMASLCASFGIGYYAGGYRTNEVDRRILEANELGHRLYFLQRFYRAFTNDAAIVAISEGTNLLHYLITAQADLVRLSSQDTALGIHTKLAVLYREIDASPEANQQIDQATRALQAMNPNQTKAKIRDAIEQLMQQEALHRRYPSRHVP
jgi:hypothetical protein